MDERPHRREPLWHATTVPSLRIAIDIDSTLHPYWDQLSEVVRARHGVELPYEDQLTWTIPQLDPAELRACVEETHRERYVLSAEPYPGAVEAVSRWHADGHYIHITSHRTAGARAATACWLERIGLPYDDLHCSWDKVGRCVELAIDVLIDDSPVNLARAQEAGITPATLLHPWNRELCRERGFLCAGSWPELERRIAGLSPTGRAA